MRHAIDRLARLWAGVIALGLGTALVMAPAGAAELVMKDGRLLHGRLGEVTGLAELPMGVDSPDHIKQIVFLDNDLCRIFVPRGQIAQIRPDHAGEVQERFNLKQRVLRGGASVRTVGTPLRIQDFDTFGRRTYTMTSSRGPMDIIQAITQITPEWTKVEGVTYMWDMRIDTHTIPQDQLHKILWKLIDPKQIEDRKKIARFYLQSERYKDARAELEGILRDFPDRTDVRQQLDPIIDDLQRLEAEERISLLKTLRAAGQHEFVRNVLADFPSKGVPGELLQAAREMQQEYETLEARRVKVIEQFGQLAKKTSDSTTREALASLGKEIATELNPDTLPRMAAFLQNLDDADMPGDEKIALAVSGWLLGADAATPKLDKAMSAYRARGLTEQYMSETVKPNRLKTLRHMVDDESVSPATMAALLLHMKPSYETPELITEEKPGYYKLEAAGLPKEPPHVYYLQLPPEYNPHRRYPMIVTLHGSSTTPEQQIDWWAGNWHNKRRMGRAARQGYIVVAPEWAAENQHQYDYTGREHGVVLECYRDACKRFSVDTDRVFLSGHSMGGDAAWDIGLSHPDLWAGVVPIVAESDRFCTFYTPNAHYVPFYVVGGELDGNKMVKNARDLDRYFRKNYNVTVVEYMGRGHEHFSDEQTRVFDWMSRFHRDFFPRDFNCVTMRQWDSFFWWLEVAGLPAGSNVEPVHWPPPRGTQPAIIRGQMTANNNLNVRTATTRLTVWLSPQMTDFKSRMNIVVNGRRINGRDPVIRPSLDTLLEDVRTRGDRLHPFWAKIDCPTGRVGGE
jgi:dienelactone hydrolase